MAQRPAASHARSNDIIEKVDGIRVEEKKAYQQFVVTVRVDCLLSREWEKGKHGD